MYLFRWYRYSFVRVRQFAAFQANDAAMIIRSGQTEMRRMANLMIWRKQMSVGNMVIDSGHQDLLGMINSLEYTIKQGDGAQVLRVFEKFCDFVRLHFRDEEKIMQAVKFPFIPHKLEHQYLLDELQNTLDKLAGDNGAEHPMDHYPEFLRNWFVSHINNGAAALKPVLQAYPYDFMPI